MEYLEKIINFHGDEVLTFQDQETGKVYVAVAMVCTSLGMTENQINTQRQKIQRDETLKLGIKKLTVNFHGQTREQLFIELEFLTGWLFKINPARFDKELRKKVLDYQLHCKDILADEFFGKRSSKLSDEFNFNEYNKENRARLDEADRLENEIRKLCILLINEYDKISWRSSQSKERIEDIYKSLKGKKFVEDGKVLDFRAINELNSQSYEIIKSKLDK